MPEYVVDVTALRKIMVDKGFFTNIALSEASGVDRNTIGKVLSGEKRPSSEVMDKLAHTLEMTPEKAGTTFFYKRLTQNVS